MINYGKDVSLSGEIDMPHALTCRNNQKIFKWCRQYTLLSESDQANWARKIDIDQTIKMFGVVVEKMQVGVCGLTSIDHINQKAEFSLWIDPKHQAKGYGKQALYTLFRHGFDDFNLNRIQGETYDGNKALDMFLIFGMKVEGIQRKSYFREGKFIDSIIVSMLREEFKC